MQIFKFYWKQRKRAILFFLLASSIFLLTFFLYDLPLMAVLYPILICVVLGIILFAWDVRDVWRKHNRLAEISRLPAALMDHLPEVRSLDDADYQAILEALRQEQKDLRTTMNLRYQDRLDYYTIWAHQIKTPIASMRLTLQNEDSPLSRQLAEEVQRIEQYVEMVLVFLRLDSDSNDYVFRNQDLDPIIKDAVRKFSNQFIRKKLRLCYEPLHVSVLTDEKWLSFVIEQVLSNALKYTQSGQITIELEEPLTLCIRDTGIGIAPEDLPRVFEKSYTGYNGRTDKKASGIGLYLCRQICTRLGHRIWINSSLESGTVVRIGLEHRELKPE